MNFIRRLTNLISQKTIAGIKKDNEDAIQFIVSLLQKIGFICKVEGESQYYQPSIIAQRDGTFGGEGDVVLYAHYDVEEIHKQENWETKPFELTLKNDRYYGRGIADNKGPFLARLQAIEEMYIEKQATPSILWLIQGEEEVGSEVAFDSFKKYILNSKAWLYVDETAYHKNGEQEFLVSPLDNNLDRLIQYIGQYLSIKDKGYNIQHRSLNKSFTPGKCPFLHNIPKGKVYFAFGPNDILSNIHRANESLDKELLFHHIEQFKKSMYYLASTTEAKN